MMEKPTAHAGWLWVTEGFALFRRQPMELATLFFCYMLLMYLFALLVENALPYSIGKIMPLMLAPVLSMGFMQACVNIETDKRVYPNVLLAAFRSPGWRKLLFLGVLHFCAVMVALTLSSVVDGGIFWQAITGQIEINQKTIEQSRMTSAMFLAAIVFVPAAMAFWYAAPLALWQKMGVGKALFYSFFAVRQAGRAFLVYFLSWFAITTALRVFNSIVINLLAQYPTIAMILVLSASVVVAVTMYCSFYPAYIAIFGRPLAEAISTPSASPPQ